MDKVVGILGHIEQRAVEAAERELKLATAEAGLKAHKEACDGISALVAGEPEAKTTGSLVDCVKAVLERQKIQLHNYQHDVEQLEKRLEAANPV